ncbi:MAG: prefoldin subunit alpha [Candidatus ainarchaeum sp.]|nr:prefoldin subunit alpha [Candidatus ainarchaeum sp.]MDD3976162.1 prefoldin subunit alpha [Candidatus ainarchaeum sp.]
MVENKKITLNKNQTISLYKQKEQELSGITSRLKEIENLLLEVNKAEQTLKEVSKSKDKEQIMVNVGAGILVECEVVNKKEAKVTLPGNIMIDKELSVILEDLKKRKEELLDLRKKFTESYRKNVGLLQQISKALNQMQISENKKQDKQVVN